MTSKHFQALADALKQGRPLPGDDESAWFSWKTSVKAVADVLYGTNPRFDRERFHRAAGYER